MGRRKIFSEEEKKERKKQYDIRYQRERMSRDPNFKAYRNRYSLAHYHRNKNLIENDVEL